MNLNKAMDLFYNDERYQNNFDYWEIDNALAKVCVFLNDMEELYKELGEEE